jgi:hypothetical protein
VHPVRKLVSMEVKCIRTIEVDDSKRLFSLCSLSGINRVVVRAYLVIFIIIHLFIIQYKVPRLPVLSNQAFFV